jgi:hypothetical protein
LLLPTQPYERFFPRIYLTSNQRRSQESEQREELLAPH